MLEIPMQFILSRHLPKTGQTTCYATFDDGHYEKGWWSGRFNWNNLARFVVSGDIVKDRATGLIWPVNWAGAGGYNGVSCTWAAAITYCYGLTLGGFSDWRLPNCFELMSILKLDAAVNPVFAYSPPFTNTGPDSIWTATTYPVLTTSALCVLFSNGFANPVSKTGNQRLLAVRGGKTCRL